MDEGAEHAVPLLFSIFDVDLIRVAVAADGWEYPLAEFEFRSEKQNKTRKTSSERLRVKEIA